MLIIRNDEGVCRKSLFSVCCLWLTIGSWLLAVSEEVI